MSFSKCCCNKGVAVAGLLTGWQFVIGKAYISNMYLSDFRLCAFCAVPSYFYDSTAKTCMVHYTSWAKLLHVPIDEFGQFHVMLLL